MNHPGHHRTYRSTCIPGPGETAYQVVLEQSDLYIVSNKDLKSLILERLNKVRQDLKGYIYLHPEFIHSLVPVQTEINAPEIVRTMSAAADLFGVGPMAAVAGAISQDIADHASRYCSDILVENGGDIYMHSGKDRIVGLLPHPDEPVVLGIKIFAGDCPCSVCSSSARIGHSLSLGQGDLVAVISPSGAVADAAATALCNMVRSRKSLDRINRMRVELQKKGVTGVLAQMGKDMAVWGNLELSACEV